MSALIKAEVGFTRDQLDRLDVQAGHWGISRAAAIRVITDHWFEWQDDPDGVDLPEKLRQPRRPS